MSALQVVHSTPSLRLSTSRNLLIGEWRETPVVEDVAAIERGSRSLNRQYAGCGILNLVLRGTPRFTDDVRAALVRLNADPTAFALGSARVLLIPGLAGVAVRAFLNTVQLVSRPTRPVQVFGDPRVAAAWLAPKIALPGVRWSHEEIDALVGPLLGQVA